jgi:hypothetical protein
MLQSSQPTPNRTSGILLRGVTAEKGAQNVCFSAQEHFTWLSVYGQAYVCDTVVGGIIFKKKIGLVDDKLWRAETGFVFSPPSRTNEERN